MINKQAEFDSEAVHLHINLLQIEKRRSGALSEKSVISLMDLIRQAEGVGDIEKSLNFCAEVLLEDAGEAKKWLDRMDNSEQQNVKDYPIMNLYQDLVSTNDEEDVIEYVNIPTTGMSVEDWEKCSELFSTNYGNYSEQSERRPGLPVKMPVSYYRKNYCQPDYFIAIARYGDRQVGHALYIRKKYENVGIMTWVVQLVVDSGFRKRGIASTLLRSIWGFSDDYAWGLATANPCTVRTLESATFRKCLPSTIKKHLEEIKLFSADIAFVEPESFVVTDHMSQIDSGFFVDNSEYSGIDECSKQLGKLKEGHEWLAFTFQRSEIQLKQYEERFDKLIAFSEKQLRDAYSRMKLDDQGWAKGKENEVAYIEQWSSRINAKSIIDLGCGNGRHSIALARDGYHVCGVDYSDTHLHAADKALSNESITGTCRFVCADLRDYEDEQQYDMAICLFDVIGSYPKAHDNLKIIRRAYRLLRDGGYLIISVMNMELTEYLIPNSQKGDMRHDPKLLLRLKPGTIMQRTGQIFDPAYMAMDTEEDLIYRKEQFDNDGELPAEYVIRDKRYRMDEIKRLISCVGFHVIDSRYVSAGHFDEPLDRLDPHAKEICVVARK